MSKSQQQQQHQQQQLQQQQQQQQSDLYTIGKKNYKLFVSIDKNGINKVTSNRLNDIHMGVRPG